MAEQTASKVPQIRFKGFEAEWEEELLGDIYTKIRNAFVGTATPYYTDKGHFYLQSNNVKNGEINRNTEVFINDYFYQSQKDKWLRANDIVMVQSGHVGHTAVIPDELDNTAAHALIIISGPSRDICSYFVNFYLQGNRAKRDLANITTGNTIKHILASEIKRFGVFCAHPTEQTKIGKYFRELDSLISLHQRKHDKLVALKKAMLQKMFPQPGATTPEIRFKGFKGEWVEKRLGEVGTFNPKDTLPEVFEYVDLESVVGTEMVNHRTETKKTAPSRAQRLAQQGDLFFQTVRPYQKNNHLFTLPFSNYVFSTGYAQIRPFDDGSFLLGLMQRDEFVKVVLSNCTGTSYPAINANVLAEIFVMIPTPEEQQKIGNYFRTLDELISQHAIQLQKLQQIKSACLEKMFV